MALSHTTIHHKGEDKMRTILGTFSKGIDGSVSINFGVSGGRNCETSCRHHPDSTAADATRGCYAARSEIRPDRKQLANKLAEIEAMPPALVCGAALVELRQRTDKGKRIPWVRISTNGSLPNPREVRGNKLFRSQFKALISFCRQHDIPVHIPVESYKKARFYRALLGDLAVVRESAQSADRFINAVGSVSTVGGNKGDGRRSCVEQSRNIAQQRRESTGRKVIVCPAVLNSFAARRDKSRYNPLAKCGSCTACADPLVDIVYPHH